jgi:hypothetical protein
MSTGDYCFLGTGTTSSGDYSEMLAKSAVGSSSEEGPILLFDHQEDHDVPRLPGFGGFDSRRS